MTGGTMAMKNKHTEPFRVVTDKYWPRVWGATHNARYFDCYDKALVAYTHSLVNQVSESVFVERVAFECRNAKSGAYAPMFESRQYHTVESYG